MESRQSITGEILQALERLPEEWLQEVLKFVTSLKGQTISPVSRESAEGLDPLKDPILTYVGGISCGSLAKDIDAALYGA